MENSANIRGPISSPEIRDFAAGYGDGPIQGPSHVAWLLEDAALDSGWRANDVLGSETDLLERFAASRDVVRGAIRIVEARGSMRMRRGCRGGLHLEEPSEESAAMALAIFLRSHGYSLPDMEKAAALAVPLLPTSGAGQAIRAVVEHAGAMLSDSAVLSAGSGNRAEICAMRIIGGASSPLPQDGMRIGNEAQLCDKFGLGRRTFRQVLNILEDLEMLQVSLGRGGGYILKPASAMGVIRRIFVLLASRQVSSAEARGTLWALATVRLHLLFEQFHGVTQEQRERWATCVRKTTKTMTQPRRWVHLQHTIDDMAGDRLISTLASAMVAYTARTAPRTESHEPIERELSEAGDAIIGAIVADCPADAERHLQAGHALLSSLNSLHEAPVV